MRASAADDEMVQEGFLLMTLRLWGGGCRVVGQGRRDRNRDSNSLMTKLQDSDRAAVGWVRGGPVRLGLVVEVVEVLGWFAMGVE
jgi:hypothetical protein